MSDSVNSPATHVRLWLTNAAFVALIKTALALPYHRRVPFLGWAVRKLVAPLAGYKSAALKNLAFIWPEKSAIERAKIAEASLDNAGRTFIENYSSRDFPKRMAETQISGPGWHALQDAAQNDQPVILVTGHFGNYEATRAALVSRGYPVGGLYRDMSNPYFNAHYVKTMQGFGGPVFPQGRAGTKGFVKHLKAGGQLVLLFDQHVIGAPVLNFMNKPAHTAISAAELALRYNAVLIPFYGIRKPDGLSFDAVLEEPIAHSDPKSMTQSINDSLSNRVSEYPGQWFWVHRRWRAEID